ncbi:MAG: hypothetical protein ACYS8Z_19335, partial [Planctomycetota bacterium]
MTKPERLIILSLTALFSGCISAAERPKSDWLVTTITEPVTVTQSADGKEIVLANSLISRTFRLAPNAATVAYDNLMTGESMLRGIKPEARI